MVIFQNKLRNPHRLLVISFVLNITIRIANFEFEALKKGFIGSNLLSLVFFLPVI